MKVVVDSSVWSLAFRWSQKSPHPKVSLLQELIADGRVVLIGAVRQELLSGIKVPTQYERLKSVLRAFPNFSLDTEDYELAASYFNISRKNGVQGANTDFLICAVAYRRSYAILTTDKDFENFKQRISISLIS